MRKPIPDCLIFTLSLVALVGALTTLVRAYTYVAPSGRVELAWEYTNQAPDIFKIYATTNIGVALRDWPLLAIVPGTSTDEVNTWTTTNAFFTITPGQMFFVATASNFWGESSFSNVTSTPPVAVLPANLRTRRSN